MIPRSSCCVVLYVWCYDCILTWTGYFFYNVYVSLSGVTSCRTSNIGLSTTVYSSFMCNPSLLMLYALYFSTVFRRSLFFSIFYDFHCITYALLCVLIRILLFWIACICYLYLVWNVRPVCPTYFNGKSMYFIWYILFFVPFAMCCILFLGAYNIHTHTTHSTTEGTTHHYGISAETNNHAKDNTIYWNTNMYKILINIRYRFISA
jgi:hypothetical protein